MQQIDEMLAGSLSQEDEDAVLAELEEITQVGVICVVSVDLKLKSNMMLRVCKVQCDHESPLMCLREMSSFLRFQQTSCQRRQRMRRKSRVCSCLLSLYFYVRIKNH